MTSPWVFDQSHYDALNEARAATIRDILPGLRDHLGLKTVLDLGCGLGYYADLLNRLDLEVLAVETGRAENVEEARRRYPHLKFQLADAETRSSQARKI